jgi:uncharacterized protein involved in exopolysaccharide biosynthesis
MDLWTILEVSRHHWLLIFLLTALGLSAGAWYSKSRPDTYSTEVLIQKLDRVNPLSSATMDMGYQGWSTDAMASEVELIRSAAVLEPVVRSMALPLALPEDPGLRAVLLAGAEVGERVAPGSYLLRETGEQLQLVSGESGEVLSETTAGGVLEGPGFRIPVEEWPRLPGDIALHTQGWADALDGLRGGIGVAQAEYTSLIRVYFTAGNATFAAAVVNGVAESYRSRAASVAREEASRRREFLAEQLAAVADSVRQAQTAMATFQQEANVLDPASEGQNLARSLREEQLRVRQLRYQQTLLQSLVTNLSDDGSGDGLERIVTLSEEMVPGAQVAYGRLRELQDERRRMTADRFGYRESSTRVAVVDSLIAGAKQELRTLAGEALDLTRTRLAEAQQEVGQFQAEVDELPAQATAMMRLEQSTEAVLANFDLLSERYYEAQIAEAVAAADVEIVDFARVPTRPDSRNGLFPVLLAGLIGLGGGAFGAVLREGLNKTIRRAGDGKVAQRRRPSRHSRPCFATPAPKT